MKSESEAEAALPPGVARSLHPGGSVEQDQLTSGGVGPGGQIGPQPETRRRQERPGEVNAATHGAIRSADEAAEEAAGARSNAKE